MPEIVDRLPDDVDERRRRVVSSSRNAADDGTAPPLLRLVSELMEEAVGREDESLRPRGQRMVSTTSPPSIAARQLRGRSRGGDRGGDGVQIGEKSGEPSAAKRWRMSHQKSPYKMYERFEAHVFCMDGDVR